MLLRIDLVGLVGVDLEKPDYSAILTVISTEPLAATAAEVREGVGQRRKPSCRAWLLRAKLHLRQSFRKLPLIELWSRRNS